jgi:MFS superfamily sulfate permease-like transporter
MAQASSKTQRFRVQVLQGVLPIKATQALAEILAGVTLAALAIPEVMGYTKISGTPVITGLYTILLPTALFAIFGSSRHFTAVMVVLIGVEEGILLAISLSLIDHTRRGYRPKNVVLVSSATGVWHARTWATKTRAVSGLLIYRFTHSMYYANAQLLADEVVELVSAANPPVRWFCIDASAVDDVDYSAAETLRSLSTLLREQGIRLVVAYEMDCAKTANAWRSATG